MGTARKKPERSKVGSARAQRRIDEVKRARNRRLLVLGGALLAVIVVAGGLIVYDRSKGDSDIVAAASSIPAAIPRDGRTLGNPDAPVTIVEYADYQCPFCGNFAREIEPQLVTEYIATGKVKLEFRDLPFLDDRAAPETAVSGKPSKGESNTAAEAAACALDQGRYWEYHDTLFANQNGENEGAFTRKRLIEIAKTTGLDVGAFSSCFDAGTHAAEVQQEHDDAEKAGVRSTPTLLLNGTKLNYAGEYADLKAAIDAALGA